MQYAGAHRVIGSIRLLLLSIRDSAMWCSIDYRAETSNVSLLMTLDWQDRGDTALMCACKTGEMNAIEWLLDEAKADVHASNVEVQDVDSGGEVV